MVVALKTLSARKRIVMPGIVLMALLSAMLVFHVKAGLPPKLTSRQQTDWLATTQVLVDSPVSEEANINESISPGVSRASIYGELMTSNAVLDLISAAAHIPAAEIFVNGPVDSSGQRVVHNAAALPSGAPSPYSIQLTADNALPTIVMAAQAPTEAQALALANASSAGLTSYVDGLENSQGVAPEKRVVIRSMGKPTVGPVTSGIAPVLIVPICLALSAIWCVMVLLAVRFRRAWREAELEPEVPLPAPRQIAAVAGRPAPRIASRSSTTLDRTRAPHEVPERSNGEPSLDRDATGAHTFETGDSASEELPAEEDAERAPQRLTG